VIAAAPTDADLLAAHAGGFLRVRRHRDRMWAVALRTLCEPEEAADALQDAFISAFRAAGNFRAKSQVTTWLHRIVVNACLDRIRRRKAWPTVPLPETGLRTVWGSVSVCDRTYVLLGG
jgi:RNA polymerase sigma-70 factor (ECF subfamily)